MPIKVLPETPSVASSGGRLNISSGTKSKRHRKTFHFDRRSAIAISFAIGLLAVIVGVEIASSDLNTRVEDRVVRNLLWKSVPKSNLYFDTPRLNFVFSDSRVVRSKLIILVETKKI